MEIAKIYRSVAQQARSPIQVVGIAVSPGPHDDYVRELVAAGILDHVDAISGHFYEEMHSYERETPINNLPRHVELLKDALNGRHAAKPVINSECGIAPVERRDGRVSLREARMIQRFTEV